MTTIHLEALAFVLFVAAAIFGLGWSASRSWAELRKPPAPAPPPLPSTMTRALPRAGRFAVELHEPPFLGSSLAGQPFNMADTGPLLFLSDKMAAEVALEREIRQRCEQAEAKIPPRWRLCP